MTREERDKLREEYSESGGRLYDQDPHFTDEYVYWLESQLCQPCKSCQMLQGQVIKQESRIRELESSQRWQPIETAPKDGTEIIVVYPLQANVIGLVSYNNIQHYWQNKGVPELGLERN